MRPLIAGVLLGATLFVVSRGQTRSPVVRFVFTSDAHYGLTRSTFRGHSGVSAHDVNVALVSDINSLGDALGPFDFVSEGGDVANRAEIDERVQTPASSWAQFKTDYIEGLKLRTTSGARTPLYVVPGNHDASNAIGFYRPMSPVVDKTPMVEIYNLMMAPAARTTTTYDYASDRVLTSRDIAGVHLVFLTVWPDSVGRAWFARDLEHVAASTPVVVFTHDQPDAQSKHFTNPNGAHDINAVDKFENLLSDTFADGATITADDAIEQTAWETFVWQHSNITAYFHGNSNWNEFYVWNGPKRSVSLHTFRVDSPMKGKFSESDERTLSYHVATIDTATMSMTVRERLWNTASWGETTTVNISPVDHTQRVAR
jgi:calcineurin-like phosphoesterase family protein